MKHFTQNLKWLLMSCLLFVGVGSAWADEETIDFSAQGYSNTQQVSETSGTKVKATFTNGSTPTAYYNTGTGVRIYGGGSVTITANGYTISKIVYTFSGGTNYAPGSTATWDPSTGTATVGATTTWEGSATSVKLSRPTGSGHWRLQKVTVTYTTGSSSDPSISADNVDIAYNATSGQIAYTVNNPATGGSMSAATSSSWVTLGSNYASPIAFTCGTNTGASERTATVTLTYTYGSNTATKDVTITQAGNPNVVNNISDITDAGTYTVKGTIVAKSTRGFIVGDGTGFVYYYNQNYDQSAYNIGDKVKLSGSVIAYGGVFEFTSAATITAATESNYVEENPTMISGSDMDTRVGSTTPAQLSTYVQYQGKLSVSGTHYNITDIDGATTAQGSISYPISTDFTSLDGATVIVKGYFVGVSSSTYYNTMLGSIEAVAGFVAAPDFDVPEGEYAEAQTVEITCATAGATIYYTIDGTDPTTSSTQYTGPVTISTTTTLKAIASDGTNVSEITSATYTIDARIETHIVFLKDQGSAQEEQIPSGSTIEMTVGDAVVFTPARMAIYNSQDQEIIKVTTQGEITYSVDNTELGTVNNLSGEVTLVSGATGTLKVTAEYAGSEEYKPCTGYYTLKVKPAQVTPTGTGDEITYDFVGVTGTSYTPWTDKTGTSGAVYAGNTSGGNTAVQMRSTNNSGIITTTSAGKVTLVTVEWNSNTSNSRTLQIYGSNDAYSATSDLYSSNTQGTLLGEICIDDGVNQLAITGDYAYIGIRSKSGALWCDKITIYWEGSATPTAVATTTTIDASGITNTDLNNGTDAGSLSATVALASDGSPITGATVTWESSVPSVATIDPTTGDVTLVAAGTTTITATYAGVSGQYQSSSATYELTVTDTTTPSAGGDYVKVTSDSDLEDGEYLIVYEAGSLAFDGSLETLDASQNTIAVTIATDNTIASSATVDAATFTIATTTNGYSIKSASGKFIGQTTDVNGMKEQDTALDNTISIDTDGNAVILASGGAYLRYNKNSGQERFRYFKSSTYTAQQPVALYKKNTAPDTRIATTVTLDPATASYDVVLGDAFTAPTATLDPAAAGTLTYTSSNEGVATVAADGTVTILAAGTTTITAKFEGSNDYKPSQASYTIVVTAPATVYTSLQQLQENVTSTSQDFTLQPATDIYVTAVKGTNNAYLSDGTYGALVYTNNHGLTVGQKFTGTLAAKFVLYKGATEITNFDATGLTITDGTLAPQTKTIGEITVANQSLPVTFENVTYDAANTAFTDGTNSIKYYNNFNLDPAPVLVDGHVYDITGIIVMYNNLQIAPLAADDVVDKTAPVAVEAPVFDPAGGTFTADQTVTITCATAGATIYYTLDGTDPTTASEEYTGPITITATTTLKAIASDGTNTSTITEATYTINKADVPTPKGIDSNYFVMVKWLDQLETGDKVLIASNEAHKAMYKQNNNNRGAFDFPYTPYQYGNFARLTADDLNYLEQFIVVREGNDFYFYATSEAYKGYIYAASSSGNQLKTKDTRDNNAKASISIDSDTGDATIQFQGTNSHNTMRYNPNNGNPIFNCYLSTSTTGSLPQIYVEVNDPTIAGTPDMVSMVVDAPDGSSWMTWVAPYDMSLPMTDNGGLEAYIVTLNAAQDDATFVRVYNVPANTPIILHAPTGGDYVLDLAPAGTVMDDVSANVLQICDGYNAVGDFDEDAKTGTVYVLWFLDTDNNADTDDVLGFYPLEAGVVLEAGKAFIKLDGSTPAKFFGVNFGDATGINDIAGDALRLDGTIYNMAGQRVSNPTRGIYIVNGKKVLVK